MNRYEHYKDSGIEWIGEIPEHWEVRRLRNLTSLLARGTSPDYEDNGQARSIPQASISSGFFQLSKTKAAILHDDYDSSRGKVLDGDVLLASTGGGVLGKVAFLTHAPEKAFADTHVTIVRANEKVASSKFIFYFLSINYSLINGVLSQGSTNQIELQGRWLKDFILPLPPLPEQTAIAAYLDRQTAEIDATLARKEAMLQKLEDLRAARIHEVVTRGLHPNAPLKDSGVEWIGEIPEHWEVRKLSYCFDEIGSGTTPPADKEGYYGGDIPWIITGDLNDRYIEEINKTVTEQAVQQLGALKVYPPNSIIVAMYGATIGKLGIMTFSAAVNQACCVLSRPSNTSLKFAFYFLTAAKGFLTSQAYGGGQPNISQGTIRSLRIPLPPLSEQTAIAEYLDAFTQKVDALREQLRAQMALLRQYRQSLITEVVTGKQRVG